MTASELQGYVDGYLYKTAAQHPLFVTTYLPEDNTATEEGIYGPVHAPKANLSHYRGRAGSTSRTKILKYLESTIPGRSRAVNVLAEAIPDDADPVFKEFTSDRQRFQIALDKLIADKKLEYAIKATRKDLRRLTPEELVADIQRTRLDFKTPPDENLRLFGKVPHYMLVTEAGRIGPEYIQPVDKTAASRPWQSVAPDILKTEPQYPANARSIAEQALTTSPFSMQPRMPKSLGQPIPSFYRGWKPPQPQASPVAPVQQPPRKASMQDVPMQYTNSAAPQPQLYKRVGAKGGGTWSTTPPRAKTWVPAAPVVEPEKTEEQKLWDQLYAADPRAQGFSNEGKALYEHGVLSGTPYSAEAVTYAMTHPESTQQVSANDYMEAERRADAAGPYPGEVQRGEAVWDQVQAIQNARRQPLTSVSDGAEPVYDYETPAAQLLNTGAR